MIAKKSIKEKKSKLRKKWFHNHLLIYSIIIVFVSSFLIWPVISATPAALPSLLLELTLPVEYKIVEAGQTVLIYSDILLVRPNQPEKLVDIVINYKIIDHDNQVITELSETKGTSLRLNTVTELELPPDLEPGTYYFQVTARTMGAVVTGSKGFVLVASVEETTASLNNKLILISLMLIVVIFLLILFYSHLRFKRLEQNFRKIDAKHLKRKEFIKQ